MSYQVKIPGCIYAGDGSIEKIKEVIAKENFKKAVIFTDQGIIAHRSA